MRILEIISDTNIGGAGVLLENRLRHTDVSKYNVCVIIPKGSALTPRFHRLGIECEEIDIVGDRSFDIKAIFCYIKILKKYSPDIVNCHGCLSARIAAKLCGIPVKICTRHCVFPVSKLYGVKAVKCVVGCANSFLSDKFIAVAYAAKENLKQIGIADKKIKVIINGAEALRKTDLRRREELKRELGIDRSAFILAFCARLEDCKGHSWFFLALKELLKQNRKCVALLIGDGSLKESLMSLCKTLEIDKSVRFIGFVSDVSPYMNIADVNINCSIGTETSSLALSEGMSLGLPAVVSDYGGNPYMIRQGNNGFVCKCNDWKAMSSYISRLMDDKELYSSMSQSAKHRFETELNAEMMAQKTNMLYDSLLNGS